MLFILTGDDLFNYHLKFYKYIFQIFFSFNVKYDKY